MPRAEGGCCLAPRYGAAAAAQQQAGAAWQMGRIMLKFRPIAPKPAAMAPAPAPAAPTPVTGSAVGAGRGKRKAVCGGGGRKGRKPRKAATAAVVTAAPTAEPTAAARDAGGCRKHCEKEKLSSRSSSSSAMTSVDSSPPPPGPQQQHQLATLPFMPVTPVEDKAAAGAATKEPAPAPATAPVPSQVAALTAGAVARPFAPRAMRPGPTAAASLVTVEEVIATWRDGEAAPSLASSAVGSGAADEAPTFVSDQWGRVTWRNTAFVRAVSADDDGDVEETPVALGGAHPAWGTCAGFTCRVRLRHSSPRRVGSCSSVVAPCDVWLLDAGGSYLWRLDLQAALTLGGRL